MKLNNKQLINILNKMSGFKVVQIEASAGMATISSADSSLLIQYQMPAQGELAAVIFDSKKLLKLLKTDSKGQAFFNSEFVVVHSDIGPMRKIKDTVRVNNVVMEFAQTCAFNSFSELTEKDYYPFEMVINAQQLLELINAVRYASAIGDTRYYLNGIKLELDYRNQMLRMIATDGHRLALHEITYPLITGGQFLLPNDAIKMLLKAIGKQHDQSLTLSFNDNKLLITAEGWALRASGIDGRFPDWQGVMPCEYFDNSIIQVNPEFVQALKVVKQLGNQRYHGVKLCFEPDRIIFAAKSEDKDKIFANVSTDMLLNTDETEVGVNANYLIDAFSVSGDDATLIYQGNQNNPLLVLGKNGSKHVIMPMRM